MRPCSGVLTAAAAKGYDSKCPSTPAPGTPKRTPSSHRRRGSFYAPNWRDTGPAAEVLGFPAKAPKPQPALECNLIPPKDLAALLEKYGEPGVCRQLTLIAVALKATTTGGVCALLGIPAEKSAMLPGTLVSGIHSAFIAAVAAGLIARHTSVT